MKKQKEIKDNATPYFSRFYKIHRKMIKEISKSLKLTDAAALRRLVEEGHKKYVIGEE